MKKLLQLITVCMLMFTAVESKAQVADGTLAPDFTFTDIAGNTQHLYALLDSGFTTYIDISAAWCGPCWAYHTSGALEGLYNAYGPHGTNVLRVLFVEGELTNLNAQLHGITGSQLPNTGYNNSTQGDWTAGTPYPMIDLSNSTPGAGSFMSSTGYQIAYFPTVYMICPDRTITLVGQATTAQLYAAKGSCGIAVGVNDAQLMPETTLNYANANLQSCDSVLPTFRLGNLGTGALTSATITYSVDGTTQKVKNWTGNIAPYGNALVTGVKVGAPTTGGHTVTATVSNPNGSTDPTASNNSNSALFFKLSTSPGPIVSESFEASGLPSGWAVYNGGDPATWTTASVGYNSTKSVKLPFYNIPTGDIDYFALDPMSFAGATAIQLTFDISGAQASSTINDKLEVDVSTNCGATWLPRYVKTGSGLSTNGTAYFTSEYTPTSATQWRHETVSLNSYANNPSVLVRFKGTSAQGNDVYIDNINFSVTMGVDELSAISEVNVFPNPTSADASVYFDLKQTTNVSVSLYNELGQQVMNKQLGTMAAGAQNYNLSTEGLRNGLYFVTIKTDNGSVTRKVSVNK